MALTSTVGTVSRFSSPTLANIRVPVLVVHHRDDACFHSPFADAAALVRRMAGNPQVDFVEVRGGSG